MSSLLARAVDRLPAPIIWPIIVTLIVAGAIAIPIGLLLWSDAASMTVPSISEYSGTVASVSSDPKFGTHMTIRAENGPSPDIFFDGVVLDVGVGDRATVWAENQVGTEWGLKFQSDRETWIDPSYGDLTKPVPPRGLFSALALGGGVPSLLSGSRARTAGWRRPPWRAHFRCPRVRRPTLEERVFSPRLSPVRMQHRLRLRRRPQRWEGPAQSRRSPWLSVA